jgi:hypothetical protein
MSVASRRRPSALDRLNHATPLLCVRAVKSLLALNEDKALALAQCGALKFVFDLRTGRARRRMLRFLPRAVLHYLARHDPQAARQCAGLLTSSEDKAPVNELTLSDAVSEIIGKGSAGPDGQYLRTPEVQTAFNVTSGHILRLIDEGSLEVVKGTVRHTGPQGAAAIKHRSLVKFLTERRVS